MENQNQIKETSSVQDSVNKPASELRIAAPEVVYSGTKDQRKALLDDLDGKYPDFIHSYQKREVTDWELQTKGQEIVRNEQGMVLHSSGDPVVRVSRKKEMARRQKEAELSLASVEAVVTPGESQVFRSPRRPSARNRNKSEAQEGVV